MKFTAYLKRAVVYVVGLCLIAFGISFSVKSNLGVSPVSCVPYALSLATGVDLGVLTTLVFIVFILLQLLILRRDFQLRNLLQILCSTLFGYLVTFAGLVTQAVPSPQAYGARMLLLALSMALIALGLFLYLCARIMPLPGEGLIQAAERKTRFPFWKIKIAFDSALVLISAAISLISLGELISVREGTVISAIGVGFLVKLAGRAFSKPLERFLYGAAQNAA